MFASPAFTRHAQIGVTPQSYVAWNGGAMFVPVGHANNGLAMTAGGLSTPDALAGRFVHSVPVSYSRPNAQVRPHNVGVAITPAGSVK